MLLLLLLYFLQGIPYGFQVKFLPLHLQRLDVPLYSVSLSRLLSLPWVCKFVFAPLYDRLSERGKQRWLNGCLLVLSACFIAGSQLDYFANGAGLWPLCLAASFASAMMDIAVDSIAIGTLSSSQLGIGNIAQVNGFKVGILVGGGGMIWYHQHVSLSAIFLQLGVVYLIATFICRVIDNKATYQTSAPVCDVPVSTPATTSVIGDVMSVAGTKDMVVFLVLYKIGEQVFLALLPLYLANTGFYTTNLLALSSVAGQVCSMIGSTAGGIAASHRITRLSLYLSRVILLRLFSLVALATCLVIQIEISVWWVLLLSCGLQFFSGAITTLTFSQMMLISQSARTSFQSTHYSTLATVEVLSKLIATSLAGAFATLLNYEAVFVLCCCCDAVVWSLMRSGQMVSKHHRA